jgi:TetR/AcrR family transcriptional repressor of nem operon
MPYIMARPIEFVYEDVIHSATLQFWKEGFVASSVQKLLDATQINRGTMYNSFGEKEAFFRTCVDRYNAMLQETIVDTLGRDDLSPASAIAAFFAEVTVGVPSEQRQYGCLLVNSLCESINWDAPLQKLIKDSLAVLRKGLLQRTRQLEKSRALAKGVNADFAADLLLGAYQAAKVGARTGKPAKQLLEQVNFSLAAILK